MTSLVFVTPARGRFALTELCLQQRKRLCDELGDATCLVVATDANAYTAHKLGFPALHSPEPLGRKVNDGIEYAVRELGAKHVVFFGSDDIALPELFDNLPEDHIATHRRLGLVRPDGQELSVLSRPENVAPGFIPWMIPTKLLAPAGYRPSIDVRERRVDGAILDTLAYLHAGCEVRDISPYGVVDLKSPEQQVTAYDRTVAAHPVTERSDAPFETLGSVYPQEFCEQLRDHYRHAAA